MSDESRFPYNTEINAENNHVSIRIEAGSTVLVMFSVMFLVLIGLFWIMRQDAAALGRTEAREKSLEVAYKDQATRYMLAERRMMDWEGLMLASGVALPSDSQFGALGNLQRTQLGINSVETPQKKQ